MQRPPNTNHPTKPEGSSGREVSEDAVHGKAYGSGPVGSPRISNWLLTSTVADIPRRGAQPCGTPRLHGQHRAVPTAPAQSGTQDVPWHKAPGPQRQKVLAQDAEFEIHDQHGQQLNHGEIWHLNVITLNMFQSLASGACGVVRPTCSKRRPQH
jgi:hypothetical protein